MIELTRAYLPDESATFGRLVVRNEGAVAAFATIERPWRDNDRSVSCIPEGVYTMRLRESPVVKRASGGEMVRGWEICDVPGRSHIMIHPGNYADDTEGCILPGRGYSCHPQHGPMVTHSRAAFRDLMAALSQRAEWTIDIRVKTAEYP